MTHLATFCTDFRTCLSSQALAGRTLTSMVLLLIALVGCGGGGGGGASNNTITGGITPVPGARFEPVTVGADRGIKDNATGLIWATTIDPTQIASAKRLPTAFELLYLVDNTTSAQRASEFSFAFSLTGTTPKMFQLKDLHPSLTGTDPVWAVDIGGQASPFPPGSLTPKSSSETSAMYVLSGTMNVTGYALEPRSNISTIRNYSGLMWGLCAEGSWSPTNLGCTGTPGEYTYSQALNLIALANYPSTAFGGYVNWRLPTKTELQTLLRLESNSAPLIDTQMALANTSPIVWDKLFWTSSVSYTNSGTTYYWGVNFKDGNVSPINLETDRLRVLLVRNAN
jgi:hypothetical protein